MSSSKERRSGKEKKKQFFDSIKLIKKYDEKNKINTMKSFVDAPDHLWGLTGNEISLTQRSLLSSSDKSVEH